MIRSVGRIKLLVSVVVKFSPNQVLNLCNGHCMDRSERKTHFFVICMLQFEAVPKMILHMVEVLVSLLSAPLLGTTCLPCA